MRDALLVSLQEEHEVTVSDTAWSSKADSFTQQAFQYDSNTAVSFGVGSNDKIITQLYYIKGPIFVYVYQSIMYYIVKVCQREELNGKLRLQESMLSTSLESEN